MRGIGFVLLCAGFFAAAFVTVRRADSAGLGWATVDWHWYVAFLAVGAAGVVILRLTARSAGRTAHRVAEDLEVLEASLARLLAGVRRLRSEQRGLDVYAVHGRIERELAADLSTFAEAREALIPRFGLQAYADVMSDFARGERNINRAWCASADGYIDEVAACLERAEQALTSAHRRLSALSASAATSPATS